MSIRKSAGRLRCVTPPELAQYWPIFGLRLATPRLILTPLQDADMVETIDLILGGIHDPRRMPFKLPWTDAPRDELIPNALRYYWTSRAASTPDYWTLPLMVRQGGVLVGMQELEAKNIRMIYLEMPYESTTETNRMVTFSTRAAGPLP